jgi:two-component system NtrC family sensor kinase
MAPAPPANILVVDDTPGNLRLIEGLLRRAGHRVRPFTSPRMALRAAALEAPDLALLDIRMPEMDGYELCRQLMALPGLEDLPVIFASVASGAIDKVKAFAAGGVDYVSKPIQSEEVLVRVHTHLALRRSRLELRQSNRQLEAALAEVRETQAQLIHAEKMSSLGVLSAGLAHEINNPLNAIRTSALAMTRMLAADPGCSEDCAAIAGVRELADVIDQASSRATQVIEGLRAFSRRDDGLLLPHDLRQGLEEALVLLRHKLPEDCEVERSFAPLPPVPCRAGLVNQVLLNLLSNAVDAVRTGETRPQRIAVGTHRMRIDDRGWAIAWVADSGPGVPASEQGRIFEPFYTTKAPGEGTGLGLAISDRIARDHGGRLVLVRDHVWGARFELWLPLGERTTEDAT